MNLPAERDNGVVLFDDFRECFQISEKRQVAGLFSGYRESRQAIDEVAKYVSEAVSSPVLSYFLSGNARKDRHARSMSLSAQELFQVDGAVAALNSDYWDQALKMTDVLDVMPTARRDQWHEQIQAMTCPEFAEEIVSATLSELLLSRSKFFAERVDGIFRGLSGEHVTNRPEGFGKRMIIANVLTGFGTSNHTKMGLIHDLRCIIAKFMGRPDPSYNSTSKITEAMRGEWGEWTPVDGGAFKCRLYKKGTAHLEIHPDMAWRLNGVLASIYPHAIPAPMRQRPVKPQKKFEMIRRPLPAAVLLELEAVKPGYARKPNGEWGDVPKTIRFQQSETTNKTARSEAESIIAAIGGVKAKDGWFQFDYEPAEVIRSIIVSGCLPDQKSHQYYPTPPELAQYVVECADIGPYHSVLEPSAGAGGIADYLPKDRTWCVEIAKLHYQILTEKGFNAVLADFIEFASWTNSSFDRIVMNPPFSEGRALAHVEAASRLLVDKGRLTAILPSSMRGKSILPGMKLKWSEVLSNQFAGTSISVVVLTADKR